MSVTFKKPEIDEHKTFVNFKKRDETNYLVVHCSATTPNDSFDWKTIDQMHRQKGWLGIGYHFVIKTDGTIQNGRPLDTLGAHVSGHNNDSVGICLIGGVDSEGKSVDNFTAKQKKSLKELLDYLRGYYGDSVCVLGHRDFPEVHKDCPCFNVKGWYTGAKFARYSDSEAFKKALKLSKKDFEDYNGTEVVEGDLVRVA